jgi:hypothetical protein
MVRLVYLATEVSSESGGFETAFLVAFAGVALLVLVGFAFVAYAAVRSARAARRAGIDPFTNDAQVLAQAISGQGRTVEQRLAELDDLHRRGVISPEEHRSARARALEA